MSVSAGLPRALLQQTSVWISLSLSLALPGGVHAQALSCQVPATTLPRPRPDTPDAQTPARRLPTASYTLAISWAPQYCRANGTRDTAAFECQTNRFGFVLHGLWPDGAGKEWPQYCRPVELLSDVTLRAHLCATPSVQLMQHEWAKHGSCMAGSADDYFARSTGLFDRLRFPDMAALSRRRGLTAGALAAAVARANPGMTPQALRVTTEAGGWLNELWFCLDLRFAPKQCPAQQGGVASSTRVRIWQGSDQRAARSTPG